jgi:hypothetical protein
VPLDDDPESAASGSSRICDRCGKKANVNRLVWVMGVLAVTALLAGCGGGSSSSTATTTTTTTRSASSEYVDQGNAICRTNRETIAPQLAEFEHLLSHGLTTPALRDEAAVLVRSGVPSLETEKRSFEKLAPPEGLEPTQTRLITTIRWEAALERLLAKALESGSTHELGVLFGRLARNDIALRGAALHLGLKVCGKLLQSPESPHGLA